jgi:spermidine/putrescine transport system substrate-binding protein
VQLRRENPAFTYVIGREGGEIWADYYAIPADAPNPAGAYALIDFLVTPQVSAREVLAHGYAPTDARVKALLPAEMLADPILFPAAELLSPLEFGVAGVLIDPVRNELFARFKAA